MCSFATARFGCFTRAVPMSPDLQKQRCLHENSSRFDCRPRSTTRQIFASNTDAARSSSPVPTTRFTSGISCSTTSSMPSEAGCARTIRGVRPVGARCPLAALGPHRRYLRTQENPKRIYYLSMEFLIGRSLANNVTNLLARSAGQASDQAEQPRLARACSNKNRRRAGQRRAGATGGVFSRFDGHDAAAGHGLRFAIRIRHVPADHSRTAGSTSSRTTGSVFRIRGKSHVRTRQVEVKLNCSFELRGGACAQFPVGRRA